MAASIICQEHGRTSVFFQLLPFWVPCSVLRLFFLVFSFVLGFPCTRFVFILKLLVSDDIRRYLSTGNHSGRIAVKFLNFTEMAVHICLFFLDCNVNFGVFWSSDEYFITIAERIDLLH